MMRVRIEVNGRLVAAAEIENLTDLAPISAYYVIAVEEGSEQTGLPDRSGQFVVHDHLRRQSVWALVEAVASQAKGVALRPVRRRKERLPAEEPGDGA